MSGSLGGLFAVAGERANTRARAVRHAIPPSGRRTIEERFDAFDAAHPEVYAEFKRLALILLRKHQEGKVKWVGAKHIFEKMRSDFYFSDAAGDVEPYRLQNDFTSRYARKLISEDARFTEVIRLRELTAA